MAGQLLRCAVLAVCLSAMGCGSEPPEEPELVVEDQSLQCAPAAGDFKATFTLRETEGDCDGAKAESHDPMAFDADGKFLSPADGLIECRTAQAGCQLAVRCNSPAMTDAKATLNAQVSADGREFTGVGIVEGSYKGCRRVVYDVHAYKP